MVIFTLKTHWGEWRICASLNWVIIGSDNGLSPVWHQAIISTKAGILLIGPLGTNFSEILIGIQTFSFKKLHLKTSSAKWRLFCLGLNELKSGLRWKKYVPINVVVPCSLSVSVTLLASKWSVNLLIKFFAKSAVTLTLEFQGQIMNWPCHKSAWSDCYETKIIRMFCWFVSYKTLTNDLACDIGHEFSASNIKIAIPGKYVTPSESI